MVDECPNSDSEPSLQQAELRAAFGDLGADQHVKQFQELTVLVQRGWKLRLQLLAVSGTDGVRRAMRITAHHVARDGETNYPPVYVAESELQSFAENIDALLTAGQALSGRFPVAGRQDSAGFTLSESTQATPEVPGDDCSGWRIDLSVQELLEFRSTVGYCITAAKRHVAQEQPRGTEDARIAREQERADTERELKQQLIVRTLALDREQAERMRVVEQVRAQERAVQEQERMVREQERMVREMAREQERIAHEIEQDRERRIEQEMERRFHEAQHAAYEALLAAFRSSDAYTLLVKFVEGAGYASAHLDKLQQLLARRGFAFQLSQLRELVEAETESQAFMRYQAQLGERANDSLTIAITSAMEAGLLDTARQEHWFVHVFVARGRAAATDVRQRIAEVRRDRDLERFEAALLSGRGAALKDTIAQLDFMTGLEFEELLLDLFTRMNWTAELTPESGDQGADLLIVRDGKKLVVQAKRYSGSVGNAAVQQVVASMRHYGASGAIVVTTSTYSKAAVELARANTVRLIDREELLRLLQEHY